MGSPFQQHGFMLSWNPGDPSGNRVPGPFMDASQDMVDLDLTKLDATNYQARVTRIVSGFSNPIDAEILSNKIYVIEYGGDQGIWEITFPAVRSPITLSQPTWLTNGVFSFAVGTLAGQTYSVEVSTNLFDWAPLTNIVATTNQFRFQDQSPTNFQVRFYRVRAQ